MTLRIIQHRVNKYGLIGGQETAEILAKQLRIDNPKIVKDDQGDTPGYDVYNAESGIQFSLSLEKMDWHKNTGYLISNGAVRITEKDINQLEATLQKKQ